MTKEKKQSRIIILSTLIAFGLGSITDVILPLLGIKCFSLSILALSILMAGTGYAVVKYKMMNITPEYVSDYIYKEVNDPIFFINENFQIKDANNIALKMTGYDLSELESYLFCNLIEENNFSLSTLLEQGTINDNEVHLIRKNGNVLQCMLSGTVIYDKFNDILGIVIIMQDVTEQNKAKQLLQNYNSELENKITERTLKLNAANQTLKKEISDRILAEEKIMYMGYHDELTGLPNRRYFNTCLANQIEVCKRSEMFFAVMFLDLDNFKFINDMYGHQGGDALLVHYANIMSKLLRKDDVLARIGGDEFLVLVVNLSLSDGSKVLNSLLQKLLAIFREPFLIDNNKNYITTSIGVACYPRDGNYADALISNADIAMYEAKTTGRNSIVLCTPEIKDEVTSKSKLRNSLFGAINKNELLIYYQPQIDIKLNKLSGFEALLRWKLNDEHFISPNEFIPIAEETGLIVPIGYWVIKTACTTLKKWHRNGYPYLKMAINLSVNQLNEFDFVDKVIKIIEDSGLDTSFLEFEITERIALKINEKINNNLYKLNSIGSKISIDDFGTDYSSFMNLKRLPIDRIKIAMEFVQGINKNPMDAAIVSSIIDLSHNLRLGIIAEGVETLEQLEYLYGKGCNGVQGFFFYKPMPAADIETILAANPSIYTTGTQLQTSLSEENINAGV